MTYQLPQPLETLEDAQRFYNADVAHMSRTNLRVEHCNLLAAISEDAASIATNGYGALILTPQMPHVMPFQEWASNRLDLIESRLWQR